MSEGKTARLRRARFSDQFSIASLILRYQLNPVDLNWSRFWVAVDDHNHVVGCGQIRHHAAADELASLAVHSDWQGQGISKMLLDALFNECEQPIWLMCESHLIPYYERFGFGEVKDVQTMPPYFQSQYRWTRPTLNMWLAMRDRYVAFMSMNT